MAPAPNQKGTFMKKIILIVLAVILVAVLVVEVTYLLRRNDATPNTPGNAQITEGPADTAGSAQNSEGSKTEANVDTQSNGADDATDESQPDETDSAGLDEDELPPIPI